MDYVEARVAEKERDGTCSSETQFQSPTSLQSSICNFDLLLFVRSTELLWGQNEVDIPCPEKWWGKKWSQKTNSNVSSFSKFIDNK